MPTLRVTEAHMAWNLTTMDTRVFLEESMHSEDSSYTILALNMPGRMVYLHGRTTRNFFKNRDRILPPGPNRLAHGRCSKGICKMINCYYKPTFGTLWAETTCISCAFFLKFPKLALRSRDQPHLTHSIVHILVLSCW